jgi:hypothetical protein
MKFSKKNLVYLVLILISICLGLASRKFCGSLPDFINLYLGDLLWATMVYFGIRFLFSQLSVTYSTFLSIMFCYVIELSQLYHSDWIDTVRHTQLGGLVLGFGFLWSDIVANTIGVFFGQLIDRLLVTKSVFK